MLVRLSALILIFFVCGCSDTIKEKKYSQQPSRIILTNGNIYTLDSIVPKADAMVFEKGKILFVGDEENAIKYQNLGSKVVDLKGKFVFPGFVDSHIHPGLIAALSEDSHEENPETLPVKSKAELFSYLERYADEKWYVPFVMLGRWDVLSFLPDGPTKEELDEIFPYRPAILLDNSGHSFWANSSALWLFGVDKNTPDLSDNISYFVRDKNEEPTGWIKEFALFPYLGSLLISSDDIIEKKLLSFLTELRKSGVTALWDAGNFHWDDEVYSILSKMDKLGKLPLHYEGSYHIWDPKQLPTAIKKFKELKSNYSGPRLQFNTIKIHYDGVSEIQTAAVFEPYVGTSDNRGGVLFTAQELSKFMIELNQENIHLHLHSVGDRSTHEILNAIDYAVAAIGHPMDINITLSHLETVSTHDITRFKQYGIFANFTPHWFGGAAFGQAGAHNLGAERSARSQEIHKFHENEALITLSSDVIDEEEQYRANPFIGLQMSVTRKEYDSTAPHKISPTTGLSLKDALIAYTFNGAMQLGLVDTMGSLKEGKKANFIILEENLMKMKVEEIHNIIPNAVYFEGIDSKELSH